MAYRWLLFFSYTLLLLIALSSSFVRWCLMPLLIIKVNWKLNSAPSLKLNIADMFNSKLRIHTHCWVADDIYMFLLWRLNQNSEWDRAWKHDSNGYSHPRWILTFWITVANFFVIYTLRTQNANFWPSQIFREKYSLAENQDLYHVIISPIKQTAFCVTELKSCADISYVINRIHRLLLFV